MNCPRCGQPLPLGALQCAHCGQGFVPAGGIAQAAGAAAAVGPGQAYVGAYVPPPTKRWPWVVGSLAAAVIALAGLRAVGLLKLGAGAPGSQLQANARAPGAVLREGEAAGPPILQEPGQAPPPILQTPATAPAPVLEDTAKDVTMPKEDLDWLKWLEKIEKEKQQLTATEQTQMMTL